ncbi:MAG: ABC transporter ATP-binding protein [Actinophytocola sp.]|uniref:ABC transporter ATP-binding protein n=1 Tax=Actinophytocola sp. TaxID=1872138 RepID=UPI003C76DFA0
MNATGHPPALAIAGLHKTFGDYVAVKHAELTVAPGSFYGLVGPNGAGKTTMLSMATGLLRPDDGRSMVFGVDLWAEPEKAKQLIGVLPDGLAMPEQLTGRELLTYTARLRGIDAATATARAGELLEVMELDGDVERTLVIDYSTGMRKKIGLAAAMLHAPKLLVLDEPFEAIDPVSAAKLKAILRGFIAAGGSIVLSSHVMALVEQMCDTVAVIAKGTVLAEGPVDGVRAGKTLEEAFVELVGADTAEAKGLSWLAS